jgi:hypothetical protein
VPNRLGGAEQQYGDEFSPSDEDWHGFPFDDGYKSLLERELAIACAN